MAFRPIPGVLEAIIILFIAFFVIVFTVIKVFSFCRIFSKAGYNWTFGLLLPLSEIVIPLVLALTNRPVCKELHLFKEEKDK
jgi:uncharacterized membrane protein HdeD (DUF308 family)